MFDKFKNLARLSSFVFIFNFLVLNFGIKPKEASASILNISSTRIINYDLKVVNDHLVFDFSRYLAEADKIENFTLKQGSTELTVTPDTNKKSWSTRDFLMNGVSYEIHAEANIGGKVRKLLFNFIYNDYNIQFKPVMAIASNNIEADLREWAKQFIDNTNIILDIISPNGITKVESITKTARDVKGSKVVFQNKKSSLEANNGYILRANVNGREYRSRFYFDGRYAKNLFPEINAGTINSNGTVNLDI